MRQELFSQLRNEVGTIEVRRKLEAMIIDNHDDKVSLGLYEGDDIDDAFDFCVRCSKGISTYVYTWLQSEDKTLRDFAKKLVDADCVSEELANLCFGDTPLHPDVRMMLLDESDIFGFFYTKKFLIDGLMDKDPSVRKIAVIAAYPLVDTFSDKEIQKIIDSCNRLVMSLQTVREDRIKIANDLCCRPSTD